MVYVRLFIIRRTILVRFYRGRSYLYTDAALLLPEFCNRLTQNFGGRKMEENEFYLNIEGTPVKVSREVYQEYYRGERKERYIMDDLKRGKTVINSEKQTVVFLPGREDSYERILEADGEFVAPGETMEEQTVRSVLLEQAVGSLSLEEQALVRELYYLGRTEREASAALHIAKTTLRRRKEQVLSKLRDIIGELF